MIQALYIHIYVPITITTGLTNFNLDKYKYI